MIFLNRKRISLIIIIILLGIFTFSYKQEAEIQKTQVVTSTPVSGKVVILDAGHGYPDERSRKQEWNNRSKHKFKNNPKSAKIIRTKWMYSNINKIR